MHEVAGHTLRSIRRLAGTIAGVVTEYHDVTRRVTQLWLTPDRYLADPHTPPDTYAEFLFRTSGLLAHEPTARARARAGR
jgi:hypothetical protein